MRRRAAASRLPLISPTRIILSRSRTEARDLNGSRNTTRKVEVGVVKRRVDAYQLSRTHNHILVRRTLCERENAVARPYHQPSAPEKYMN